MGHVEPAADRAAAVASFQQCVDGRVPGSDAVGEPVALPRRDRCLFGRRGLVVLFPGRFGDEDAKTLAVAGDGPLGRIAEVVPKVPAVSNLGCLGCSGRGAYGEERSSVSADHFHPWPLRQPLRQAGCLSVGQQVHRSTGLDIDQDRAVDTALTRRVLTRHGSGSGSVVSAAQSRTTEPEPEPAESERSHRGDIFTEDPGRPAAFWWRRGRQAQRQGIFRHGLPSLSVSRRCAVTLLR